MVWEEMCKVFMLAAILVIQTAVCEEDMSIDNMIIASMAQSDAVDFMQENDTVLVELDMKFKTEDWQEIQENKDMDMEVNENKRKKRKAIRSNYRRWTNRVVPYYINPDFTSSNLAQIRAAIADWERYTCLDFRPYRNGDANYVRLQNGGGCSSFVGMQGGAQPVSLAPGCRVKSIIIHELGHAIGFQHEQTRPDRDSYVSVYYQNILRGTEYNFQKYSTNTVNNFGVPYDYYSVMHYGGTAFSANGQYTIVTRDSSKQSVIGRASGLSFRDIKLANLMYSCSNSCPSRSCPGEGFVGKDCQCWCPGNPVQRCQGGSITTTTRRPVTTTTRRPQTTTTRPTGDCVDGHIHCESWAATGECQKNPAYMLENCKKSCKVCTDGGGGGGNCEDANTLCPTWASSGECTKNPAYMLAYCKKSCQVCGGGGGGGGGNSCENHDQNCDYWASWGYCTSGSYREYMRMDCPKACGYCSGNPTCGNNDQNCDYWASVGYCTSGSYREYMKKDCRKTCRYC